MSNTQDALSGAPPDTGGADLGHMGNVGGRMPGLKAATTVAADLAPALAVGWLKRKAAKDYNDQPADKTVGTELGNAVREAPEADI